MDWIQIWGNWWKKDDYFVWMVRKRGSWMTACHPPKMHLKSRCGNEMENIPCHFPYSKRKRYKTKTELTREGCARASWKMLKWFLPVGTRAIANEIENYLCDLGPGINLFFSFDGFPFVLFSLLFFRWLFTFVTIIKPILFLFKFQFFFQLFVVAVSRNDFDWSGKRRNLKVKYCERMVHFLVSCISPALSLNCFSFSEYVVNKCENNETNGNKYTKFVYDIFNVKWFLFFQLYCLFKLLSVHVCASFFVFWFGVKWCLFSFVCKWNNLPFKLNSFVCIFFFFWWLESTSLFLSKGNNFRVTHHSRVEENILNVLCNWNEEGY